MSKISIYRIVELIVSIFQPRCEVILVLSGKTEVKSLTSPQVWAVPRCRCRLHLHIILWGREFRTCQKDIFIGWTRVPGTRIDKVTEIAHFLQIKSFGRRYLLTNEISPKWLDQNKSSTIWSVGYRSKEIDGAIWESFDSEKRRWVPCAFTKRAITK